MISQSSFLATVVALAAVGCARADGQCLRYEPDTVRISGILTRETFPGRPNYESIQDGDEPETGFYLHLPRPLCMHGSAGDDVNHDTTGVTHVQIVLDPAGFNALRPYLGTIVDLRGTLFAAHTGHHHV